jgi:hypothetical protein
MSEVVEIRTGTEVSNVVEQLAKAMGDETLCFPVPRTVADGEWVRFTILLEDGTHVIEGVGRCEGAVPRGNPTDHYELHLGALSFDERNEIMYERMLIAREAVDTGDDTGVIRLEDVAMEDVAGADEVSASAPPKRSVPPPPPAVSLKEAGQKAGAPGKTTSTTPSTASRTTSAKPPPLATASRRTLGTSAKKPDPKPADEETKVDLEAPVKARRDSVRPSRRPVAISDGPYALEVPSELVARARRLEDRLARKLLDRDRTPGQPEAAVLKTAIRVGLAALESLADDA